MMDAIELWQVPLLVAGVILVGNLIYTFVAKRSSRITALRIKFVGVVALAVVALFLSYRLVELEEFPVVVGLVTVALDGFVAWVAMHELKVLRLVQKEREDQRQPAE